MKTAFTSGEWYANNTAGDHDIEIYTEKSIALVRGTDEEAQANARLMKNAPKLLAALLTAQNMLLDMGKIIREKDEEGDFSEFWTNDGDYIPGFQFRQIEDAIREATTPEYIPEND
jgi:hypothetical protein